MTPFVSVHGIKIATFIFSILCLRLSNPIFPPRFLLFLFVTVFVQTCDSRSLATDSSRVYFRDRVGFVDEVHFGRYFSRCKTV